MTSDKFIKHYKEKIDKKGQKLVTEFFITFSRFECALKATITFANGNEKGVKPNWDTFVLSIRENFNKEKTLKLKKAVNYLLEFPPKIQSLKDGELTWKPRIFSPNTLEIIRLRNHIADIRNNLFHGGKFHGRFQPEISRNYKLIKSALIVLNEWLNLSEPVKTKFLKEMG